VNTPFWLYMLKYFFEIVVKKPSLDKGLVLLAWKKLYELLKLIPAESVDNRKNFVDELHAEEDEYAHADFAELREYFLKNTIQYVDSCQAGKQDNVVLVEVVKNLLVALRDKGNAFLFEDE